MSSNKLHLLLTEILPSNIKKDKIHFSFVTMCLSKDIVATFFCFSAGGIMIYEYTIQAEYLLIW